ncbi:chloroplast lipoate protein ligase [Moniliophthora roreri]|nr:chloroplast lipoate protein ligase [Moniliophthora roreri]
MFGRYSLDSVRMREMGSLWALSPSLEKAKNVILHVQGQVEDIQQPGQPFPFRTRRFIRLSSSGGEEVNRGGVKMKSTRKTNDDMVEVFGSGDRILVVGMTWWSAVKVNGRFGFRT